MTFSSFYQDLLAQRSRMAQERLSPQEWQATYEEGRRWSQGDALAHARRLV